MICSSLQPTFSKMKGVSLSFISVCRRCCVSLNRKRLASLFSSRTFLSMLFSKRNLSRCLSVQSAEEYSFHCSWRSFSASSSSFISLLLAKVIITSRSLLVFDVQFSALSRCFSRVLFLHFASLKSSLRSLLK